jgi:hypothetical protein
MEVLGTATLTFGTREQGCQMLYFQTKNHNLSKFWRILQCWHILWTFGLFSDNLINFMAYGIIGGNFGIFFPVLVWCTEKNLATLHASRGSPPTTSVTKEPILRSRQRCKNLQRHVYVCSSVLFEYIYFILCILKKTP